jgi:hypothetical protein
VGYHQFCRVILRVGKLGKRWDPRKELGFQEKDGDSTKNIVFYQEKDGIPANQQNDANS